MTKSALALMLILALLFSAIVGTELVYWAEANPTPHSVSGTSEIEVSAHVRTNNTNSAELTVEAGASPGVWVISYSLDGGSYKEIAPGHPLAHDLTETVTLTELPKGSHLIEVRATAMANDEDGEVIACTKVYFTITKTLEPTPTPGPTATPTPTTSPSHTPVPAIMGSKLTQASAILGIAGIIAITTMVLYLLFRKKK